MKAILNQIICGNTLSSLTLFPSDFVDCIITSPPYWGLRDYSVEGQIGLEKTLEEYIEKLLAITRELKRILKPSGVMFWNHGDCYGGSGCGTNDYRTEASKSIQGIGKNIGLYKTGGITQGFIPKCMVMQNYRLILRMIDEQGWILRNTIIWQKSNSMPSSVKDRFTNCYEPVFMLVKNKKYWFDLDAVRQPSGTYKTFNRRVRDVKLGKIKSSQYRASEEEISQYNRKGIQVPGQSSQGIHRKRHSGYYSANGELLINPAGKNPGDVWKLSTQPFKGAHFATFPEKLIEPMIKAGCPEWICKNCGKARVRISKVDRKNYRYDRGDHSRQFGIKQDVDYTRETLGWTDCGCNAGWESGIVLDPFFGAGTVGVVAKRLNRNWIGIDLNPEYCKMAEERIAQTTCQLSLELPKEIL